jgi:hypothetical protein
MYLDYYGNGYTGNGFKTNSHSIEKNKNNNELILF